MSGTVRTIPYLLATSFPDNTTGLIAPVNVRDLTATLRDRSFQSITQYGAVGDDATDNTTAITNAIASGAKTIFVPDGVFRTGALTLGNAGQTLWISAGGTIKATAALAADLITVTASNVILAGGGTIDGNRSSGATGKGVMVNQTTGVRVNGLTIVHCGNCAVYGRDCSYLTVANCTTSDTGSNAIFAETLNASTSMERVSFIGNNADRSAEAAASISEGGIKMHATATGSYLDRCVMADNHVRLPTSPASGSCIAYEFALDNRRCIVANNTSLGGAEGISFDTSTQGIGVGNAIFNASLIGLECAGCIRTAYVGNIVEGNSLTNDCVNYNQIGGINTGNILVGNTLQNWAVQGVVLNACVGATMSGNVLRNATVNNSCVEVNGSENVTITGGEMDGNSTCYTGVSVEDGDYCTVTGVYIHHMTNSACSVSATSPATRDNITLNDCQFVSIPAAYSTHGTGTIGNNLLAMNCVNLVGATSAANGNARRGNCLDWKNQVWDFIGSGSPASSVTAGPGSLYRNQAGGATTTLYVKETGTGNTGWIAK